jgi:hypothetical protein
VDADGFWINIGGEVWERAFATWILAAVVGAD